jgi:valyl-tRNA synthetase
MMDNRLDPAAIEARIAARWAEADAFAALRPGRETAEPYCIVIPPPNVTGSLHIGHALNNTLQDVLCRYWRMRGRDVLWQPGTDHAGIATQMMVERKLASENRADRRSMGREAFLKEVWAWKEQSGGTIVNQLKRLGASCDWSRERFTMDEGLSRAVLKVFVDLHKKGLVYKARRLVNWDPKLLTAISDLEVEQREIKGQMWYFDYPLADDPSVKITVGTTRPETMLGDTAVAVHPDDERWKPYIGKMVRLPLVNRLIPIIADTYSDPDKGSGAVKITPAHDFNDFEVGKRHGLPLVNIFTADAKVTLNELKPVGLLGVSDYQLSAVALALEGLDRFEARKRIVAWFEDECLLNKIEPNTHAVPHGDRSGVPIEPWLTEQWYVDVKPLAEKAMAAVRLGETRLHPPEREKIFFQWMENIEPWCVSRQLWWGHQIPAWYGPSVSKKILDGTLVLGAGALGDVLVARGIFVSETAEGAAKQAREFYAGYGFADVSVSFGESINDALISGVDCANVILARDPDVLDTWFSSALWPFSTLGWPDETPELAKFYPTQTLVTAPDILFFWVARMMMTGIEFMGRAPFADVILHGIVRDEKGKKMSKTTGNVIDPLDVIETYGADALRFTLAAMTAGGRNIKLSLQRVEGYRNFATKIWNAARFAEMNACVRIAGFAPAEARLPLNRWVLGEAAKAARDVAAGIEGFRFNEAADAAYRFVWGVFCDWYIELAKPVLQAEADSADKAETRATTAYVIDVIAGLLHPFMPFMTEELWAVKGEAGPAREMLLCHAPWPDLGGFEDPSAEAEIGFVVDLISEVRSVRTEANVPGGAQVELVLVGASAATRAVVGRWEAMIARLARASALRFEEVAPAQSAVMVVRGETVALPLAGLIDLAAERARLMQEKAKLDGDIASIERKLANPDFVAKAPEEVIEENRERVADARARLQKINEALARLG